MDGDPHQSNLGGPLTFAAALAALLLWAAAIPLATRNDGDLLHLWAAGRAFDQGQGMYDAAAHKQALAEAVGEVDSTIWLPRNDSLGAFFYPPPAMLPYALLGALPLQVACAAMAALNLLAAVAAGLLIARPAGLSRAAGVALVLLLPSSFFAFALGQNGILTLLVLLGAGLLCAEGRPRSGGFLLGLLLAKPSWLLATCWLPLLVGGAAVLPGMVAGAAATATVGLLLGGVASWTEWLARAPAIAALSRLPDYPLHLQYNLAGLVRRHLPTSSADLLSLGLALAVVGLTVGLVRRQRLGERRPLQAWAAGMAAATLVNPHVHHYDMLPVLPALALLAGGHPGRWRGPVLLLLLLHFAAPVVTTVLDLEHNWPLPTLTTLLVWGLMLVAPTSNPAARP